MQIQCINCENFNSIISYIIVNVRTDNPMIINTCKKCRTPKEVLVKTKRSSPLCKEAKQTRIEKFLNKILNN